MKSISFKINSKTDSPAQEDLKQNDSLIINNETHVKEKVIDTNIITSKKPRKHVENIYYFN